MPRSARLVRRARCAVLLAVTAAPFVGLAATPAAQAATATLDRVVIANAGHGFIVARPGELNGPLDGANITKIYGGAHNAMMVAFGRGEFTGFIRVWRHAPVNGDAVIVTVLKPKNPTTAASFLAEFTAGMVHSGWRTFDVTGVASATGVEDRFAFAGRQVRSYNVAFAQGGLIVAVNVTTRAGGLHAGVANALARRQVARISAATGAAPPSGSSSSVVVAAGAIVLALMLVGGFLLLSRSRTGSSATASGAWGAGSPTRAPARAGVPPRSSSDRPAPPTSTSTPTPTGQRATAARAASGGAAVTGGAVATATLVEAAAPNEPRADATDAAPAPSSVPTATQAPSETSIFCSWCGKERPMGAHAIHHCGSMQRPPAFCLGCGTALVEGAPSCATCGTPADETSKRR